MKEIDLSEKIRLLQGKRSNRDFATLCDVSEGLIRNIKNGSKVSTRTLEKIAKGCKVDIKDLFTIDNNTANISTGNKINGDISQSIGIEQHHPAASPPTSSAPTIDLSPMEHEIILLMREHMSMAEQRALLLELRSEAAKFA